MTSPHPSADSAARREAEAFVAERVIPATRAATMAARPLSPRMRAFILSIDRFILRFSRHWLLVTNVMSFFFIALPVVAAWCAANDLGLISQVIFFAYKPYCHQRPDRSYFPWGQQMAFCQRDTAIYATLFLAGLIFIAYRHRIQPLRWRNFLLLIAPMALDGFSQLFGLRESTWELRTITGTLFGIATVWLIYPHLETGMAEMGRILEARFRRLAIEERAAPGPVTATGDW